MCFGGEVFTLTSFGRFSTLPSFSQTLKYEFLYDHREGSLKVTLVLNVNQFIYLQNLI